MKAGGTQVESVKERGFGALVGGKRALISLGNMFVAKKSDNRITVSVYTPKVFDPERSKVQKPTGLLSMTEDEARRLALQLLLALEGAEQEPVGECQQTEMTLKLRDTEWEYR